MTTSLTLQAADEALSVAGADPRTGLSSVEAALCLMSHGPNELRSQPREAAWRRFLKQFADPLVYLLFGAMVISLAAWFLEGASGLPIDVVVILLIVLANVVIDFVQENRAADAVAALADMTAAGVTVLRDSRLATVPAADLVPDDVLMLGEGDAVAANTRLINASLLQVQEASFTGESGAVTKTAAPLPELGSLGDRYNMVFKGTAVARGMGRAVVTGTGMDTEMGHIATLLDETADESSPLQREITQISRTLGVLVIGIAVAVMVVVAAVNGVSSFHEVVDILLLGVPPAVTAMLEGLPAILSLVLAIGVQAMVRRNTVMKDLHSVETLESVSVIASDKTGTLTKNETTVREIVAPSGRVELTGTGYEPVGAVVITGDEARTRAEAERTLAAGALANNAQLAKVNGTWGARGGPTEAAFLVAQHKLEGVSERIGAWERIGEMPFISERRMMSVLGRRTADEHVWLLAKGAPGVLLERCTVELVGDDVVPLSDERRDRIGADIKRLSVGGYRTLDVARRRALEQDPATFTEDAEYDLVHLGVVVIIDPPRPEAVEAIAEAYRAGIRAVMITGDHSVTAACIAADLGITEEASRALTGHEIEPMDEEELDQTARDVNVYACIFPEHKLRIVNALQAGGQVVFMTGDGVNDAPALKSANIGIAMGITDTEATKEVGEMVLGDNNYSTIIAAVRQGRGIFDNIKESMRYLLSSNMDEVVTVFLAILLGGLIGLADPANPAAAIAPLLATQALWISLVTDSGPVLVMGVDPETDDVMDRDPRKSTDRIIDTHMWQRIIGVGLVMGLPALLIYDLTLPGGLVGGLEDLATPDSQFAVARTTAFIALVFMQLFNALDSRSDTGSVLTRMLSNAQLWGSAALVTVLQTLVVGVPFLQSTFGTAPLDWIHWAVAVDAGVAVLLYEEIVKLPRHTFGAP